MGCIKNLETFLRFFNPFVTTDVLYSNTKKLNTKRDGPARLLPALAGADLIFQWVGMLEYIPCYSGPAEHWGLLPATRLASREILIEQNFKKRTGPALWVLYVATVDVRAYSIVPDHDGVRPEEVNSCVLNSYTVYL